MFGTAFYKYNIDVIYLIALPRYFQLEGCVPIYNLYTMPILCYIIYKLGLKPRTFSTKFSWFPNPYTINIFA